MKNPSPGGLAILYCQNALASAQGKIAHGLLRRSRRYRILSVVDASCSGRDAGEVLDGTPCGIPVFASARQAVEGAMAGSRTPTHLIFGLSPEGGRLSPEHRVDLLAAIGLKLHVVAALHELLAEDPMLSKAARSSGVALIDVLKPPPRTALHTFTGKIEQVRCSSVAVLGTDAAVGKRTTAWLLVDALRAAGLRTELIGTGPTSRLQGARYGVVLASLLHDFVAGEIEHVVWRAWQEQHPDVLVVEGQGSLLGPSSSGSHEILAAARPDAVILQHAPRRRQAHGFPGTPLQPLERQIQAVELLAGRPVVAIALNPEGLRRDEVPAAASELSLSVGLPVCDPLTQGTEPLLAALRPLLRLPGGRSARTTTQPSPRASGPAQARSEHSGLSTCGLEAR